MSDLKHRHMSLDLEARLTCNREVGDLLVYQLFENEILEKSDSERLKNQSRFAFLYVKSNLGQSE